MNSTLSISLNESWTPATLSFQATKKDLSVPKLAGSSLWADAAANVLIAIGGDSEPEVTEDMYNVSHTSLWIFTPDGSGGGEWGNISAAGASGIGRRAYSASVVCAGTGLQLGGYGSISTDAIYSIYGDGIAPVSGLVSYNLSSPSLSSGPASWSNTSGPASSEIDVWGSAVCLSSYGQAGLAGFMGGLSMTQGGGDPVSFQNLTFYDPQLGHWYWQMTNGKIPPPRQQFCAVAVEGLNGTTEM